VLCVWLDKDDGTAHTGASVKLDASSDARTVPAQQQQQKEILWMLILAPSGPLELLWKQLIVILHA
jgi:hypothetical protein